MTKKNEAGMTELKSRIDAMALISVKCANPNGDPYSGKPREIFGDYGMISSECIKHKIRHALKLLGFEILYQLDGESDDGCKSIEDRIKKYEPLADALKKGDLEESARLACEKWIDVRAFGILAPAKGSLSLTITGPITFENALTVSPVNITEYALIKGINAKTKTKKNTDGNDVDVMSSDRSGLKSIVEFGLYKTVMSVKPYVAAKTGLSAEDMEAIHKAFLFLFEDDASASRPAGSINLERLYWWDHSKTGCGKLPPLPEREVTNSVVVKRVNDSDEYPMSMDDFSIELNEIEGIVKPEVYFAGQMRNL